MPITTEGLACWPVPSGRVPPARVTRAVPPPSLGDRPGRGVRLPVQYRSAGRRRGASRALTGGASDLGPYRGHNRWVILWQPLAD